MGLGGLMDKDSWERGEIRRRAELLFRSRGQGALEYANIMVGSMQKKDDKDDLTYWEGVARQVELLIEEGNNG